MICSLNNFLRANFRPSYGNQNPFWNSQLVKVQKASASGAFSHKWESISHSSCPRLRDHHRRLGRKFVTSRVWGKTSVQQLWLSTQDQDSKQSSMDGGGSQEPPSLTESHWQSMAQIRKSQFSLGVWSLGGCPHSSGRLHPHTDLRSINQPQWAINRFF